MESTVEGTAEGTAETGRTVTARPTATRPTSTPASRSTTSSESADGAGTRAAQPERAATPRRAAAVDERAVEPDPVDPPEPMLRPDGEAVAWGTWAREPVSNARRWLAALWWIGGLLLALGVGCLAYVIWANNETAGQQYQDFWITVFSSGASQVYGPAMTIGLATLVATGVLQTLAPGLREKR